MSYPANDPELGAVLAEDALDADIADNAPKNWRKWDDSRIETWVVFHEDTEDDSVISLISDMEDELDKRLMESSDGLNWDAREGERPSWDV